MSLAVTDDARQGMIDAIQGGTSGAGGAPGVVDDTPEANRARTDDLEDENLPEEVLEVKKQFDEAIQKASAEVQHLEGKVHEAMLADIKMRRKKPAAQRVITLQSRADELTTQVSILLRRLTAALLLNINNELTELCLRLKLPISARLYT